MSRIAFIGLGIMGSPMAANLARAGHQVTGHDHKQSAMDRLAAAGGRAAATVAAAVEDAEIVVTMLPDWPAVEEVVRGPGGVFDTVRAAGTEGVLYIDFSTIRPETSRELARTGAGIGVRVLDAPVSGGEAGAIEGRLSIMVGGEPADFGCPPRPARTTCSSRPRRSPTARPSSSAARRSGTRPTGRRCSAGSKPGSSTAWYPITRRARRS